MARSLWRGRFGIAIASLAMAAALLVCSQAQALSIAPEAAKEGCTAGEECVTTQPSTPAWLTIAAGEDLFTQQSLTGVAADEYGSNSEADPTLYGSSVPYATAASTAQIVGSALANLSGTEDPGDTYAALLRADRTLEVLGPQSSGYAEAASVTVPGSGTLVGVAALAPPPGSGAAAKVIVVTDAGFYIYEWSGGASPSLQLEPEMPTTALAAQRDNADVGITAEPQYQCPVLPPFPKEPGDCPGLYTGPYEFVLPENWQLLSVDQAPPGKGESGEAPSSFAIAYSEGPLSGTYGVDLFAYESDGNLHLVHRIAGSFPTTSVKPLEVAYATSGPYLRAATVTESATAGLDTMTSFDEAGPASSVNCPSPVGGGLASISVDAISNEGRGPYGEPREERRTGASLCVSTVSGGKVDYRMQRTDQLGTGVTAETAISTSLPGQVAPPAGAIIEAADATLDFPCDEFLHQFASHPTPDGFPEATSGYCAPVTTGGGGSTSGKLPLEPEFGAAGVIAAQIQYVAREGLETRTLRQHSLAFPAVEFNLFHEPVTEPPKGPESEYDEELASLGTSQPPAITMLPLNPAGITWSGHLVLNAENEVLRTASTSNPLPIALMSAPPFYAGAEQQVTPTATDFTNTACSGSGTDFSNTVGAFGGVDIEWGASKYEIEALAKVEASWTQSTLVDNCEGFDQQFIAGNFGNNYLSDNSVLFRVDTGQNTYLDLAKNSLGVGLTPGCGAGELAKCNPIFVPESSQYALQTVTQLEHPQPNNFYAEDDEELERRYGSAIDATFPKPGNPSSYPKLTSGTPSGCASAPSGIGSGNAGIVDANPFVAPTVPPPPNLLEAPQASEVNPASGSQEPGTNSTLEFDSSKETTSSAEFSFGAEVSAKIFYAKFGAEYMHGIGSEMTQSFDTGTKFSGGVFDFNGFYDPYSYRLYECKQQIEATPAFSGGPTASIPVFLVDYMTEQSTDKLPLNMVTPSLPEGTAGQEYSGQVFASGGVPHYSYAITSGSLPPGLGFDGETGQVSGTPTEAGSFEFTVEATDQGASHATQHESITINPGLSIENPLPPGEVGVPYSQPLGVSGGTPGYTYLLTSSGTVPSGLGIDNSAGSLEGTPTKTGTFCFGVYVADSGFPKATLDTQTCVTITDPLALEPAALPQATEGQAYHVALQGSGGIAAGYKFVVASGALPAGLSLDEASGALEGTPTESGSFPVAIELSDGSGGAAERSYDLQVSASGGAGGGTGSAPAIESADSATFAAGQAGSFTVTTSGSPAAVVAESGALPAGVTFSGGAGGTATISGTPTAGSRGAYPLTLTAQNGVEPSATQSFTLRVEEGPAIISQPIDRTTSAPGGSAIFLAAASGAPAPALQWERSTDGGATWTTSWISGPAASTSPLVLSGLEASSDGYEYRATFTNSQGTTTTNAATLTVEYPPTIESQPADQAVSAGGSASFEFAAAGEPQPATQWQVSIDEGTTWTDISGATSHTLALASLPFKDDGNLYRAALTNSRGTAVTRAAKLRVHTLPVLTQQPADVTVLAGEGASFTANAAGNPDPSVQWEVSSDAGSTWAPLGGATSPTLTIGKAEPAQDGNRYRAVFTNAAGSVTSSAAKLSVHTVPVLTRQPADVTVAAGEGASFSAAAEGNPNPSAQWQVSADSGNTWTNVAGAESPSLMLGSVPVKDDGFLYRVIFSDAAGSVTSGAARLSVLSAPSLIVGPSSTTVPPGANAVFAVLASGSPTPDVQWQVSENGGKAWSPIAGATEDQLTLSHVEPSQNGNQYRAAISNSQGSIVSPAATLIVNRLAVVDRRACTAPSRRLRFPRRKIRRVRSYTVFLDGVRLRTVHGRHLRAAKLPALDAGWHVIRIVAHGKGNTRLIVGRVYFECKQVKSFAVVKHRRH